MKTSVFDFTDYKAYLLQWLDNPEQGGGRGARTRLAQAINCQLPFVAQIFNGSAHLSPEQAEATNQFLGHTEDESEFFLLLVQLARAGTESLKLRIRKRIDQIRESRLILKNRLGVPQPLSKEKQAIFYSSWHYTAIHALISIPKHNTPQVIARDLQLDLKKVMEILQFLLEAQLISKDDSGYHVTTQRTHLGADSPFIVKHHSNWRLQAIRSAERGHTEDLHYSSVVSLSHADTEKIRELITQLLEQSKKIIRKSPEERLQCFSIDFFEVK